MKFVLVGEQSSCPLAVDTYEGRVGVVGGVVGGGGGVAVVVRFGTVTLWCDGNEEYELPVVVHGWQ